MNLYILWTDTGVKLACRASFATVAIAKALERGHNVSSWDIGQMADAAGAIWIE